MKIDQGQMLQAFLRDGWNGLNDIGAMGEEALKGKAAASVDLCRAYFRCFATPDGQRVLDDLLGMTLLRKTWDGNRSLLESVPYGFMRQGQNDIVSVIMSRVAGASNSGYGSFRKGETYEHEIKQAGSGDGTDGTDGTDGANGTDGTNGTDGADGTDDEGG